jgi:hypothetical protein
MTECFVRFLLGVWIGGFLGFAFAALCHMGNDNGDQGHSGPMAGGGT